MCTCLSVFVCVSVCLSTGESVLAERQLMGQHRRDAVEVSYGFAGITAFQWSVLKRVSGHWHSEPMGPKDILKLLWKLQKASEMHFGSPHSGNPNWTRWLGAPFLVLPLWQQGSGNRSNLMAKSQGEI